MTAPVVHVACGREVRDLGRDAGGGRTDAYRTLAWYMGDNPADAVCRWATLREDGADQINVITASLVLLNKSSDPARQLVAGIIRAADPAFDVATVTAKSPFNTRIDMLWPK